MEGLQSVGFQRPDIERAVLEMLENLTCDWETDFTGPIGPHTCLVADLACCSIDIVQLAIALEEHFGKRNLPFQQLVTTAEGNYVDDIKVSELVDFLCEHLNSTLNAKP